MSKERNEEQEELLSMAKTELKELEDDPYTERKKPTGKKVPVKKVASPSISTDVNIRRRILRSTLDRANSIYDDVTQKEKSKDRWRVFFIVFCCVLLTVALLFVGFVVIAVGMGKLSVEKEVIIALLTYIVANFFTILIFMVKYVHSSQYLETFRTVTHKLLDYILADKNGRQPISDEETGDLEK